MSDPPAKLELVERAARHSRGASSFPRSRAQRSTHSGPRSSSRKVGQVSDVRVRVVKPQVHAGKLRGGLNPLSTAAPPRS
jgi:hypothetical protein